MKKAIFLIAIILFSLDLSAATVWDESINGDLNDDYGVPTVISVFEGSNVITGYVGRENSDWLDVFSFDMDSGLRLSNVIIDFYNETDGNYTTLLLSPMSETCNCGGYDVYSQIFETSIGQDFGSAFIQEYNNDLSQYFLLAESQSNPATYSIDYVFTLTAVPVPASVWLFGSGLLGLIGMARRNKKL